MPQGQIGVAISEDAEAADNVGELGALLDEAVGAGSRIVVVVVVATRAVSDAAAGAADAAAAAATRPTVVQGYSRVFLITTLTLDFGGAEAHRHATDAKVVIAQRRRRQGVADLVRRAKANGVAAGAAAANGVPCSAPYLLLGAHPGMLAQVYVWGLRAVTPHGGLLLS